ncbi:Wzz/FepE/Etk N-terminal domain-containing protein [Marinobacter adhaerens]|uniref:Wzz/FepE/Etk N-terminal domain-containing protein n=1 Tax=Marinobacter adhaerens TaxID=1033846 RepID=UPI001E45B406|nr:Wzz/FepE/Etk N-terminal domain-containing protein [Marinobacter adhaerens]MCD1648053.1 lipopolysaccharide biosynthesis protein [Marinobacter adhaerens]
MTRSAEQHGDQDDITLVDLAAVLVENRITFFLVFVLIAISGFAYALLAPEKHQYASLVQMARDGAGQTPLESPTAMIASLESRWLPDVADDYMELEGEKLPIEVSFSNPNGTALIRMASEAEGDDANTVKRIHEAVIEKIQSSQAKLLAENKTSLENEMESLDKVIEGLQAGRNTDQALVQMVQRKANLKSKLDRLQGAQTLAIGRESLQSTGPRRTVVVVLAVGVGGILGVFSAFLVHFVRQVRMRVNES